MAKTLAETHRKLEEQKKTIVFSAKMSALGEMSENIAHEINTPLATIQLYAGRLQDLSENNKLDLANVLRIARSIEKTTQTISKIIRGLQVFARTGEGDSFESVAIANVIDDTIVLARHRLIKHSIELRLKLPEIPLMINCRPTQISQVLLNLVGNSIDAVQGLSEKWIKIEVIDLPKEVQIVVTDSGSGIDAETVKRIMEPFFTTKPAGAGTGLGLSISKSLIESHHGTLEYDDTCENTCFRIRLPKKQQGAC
jgi:C4-dicarboxylate-specific signal transduction histidine kinase